MTGGGSGGGMVVLTYLAHTIGGGEVVAYGLAAEVHVGLRLQVDILHGTRCGRGNFQFFCAMRDPLRWKNLSSGGGGWAGR